MVYNQTGYCIDNTGYDKGVYYLESVYFAESQNLTLVISDVVWLDKNAELIKVDLVDRSATDLPAGAKLIHVGKMDNTHALSFSAPNREPAFFDLFYYDMGRQFYSLFEWTFFDEAGNEYSFATGGNFPERYEIWDSIDAWETFLTPEEYDQLVEDEDILFREIHGYRQGLPPYYKLVETPGWFGMTFFITDYPHDTLYLKPAFTHTSRPNVHFEIDIQR